MVEKRTKGERLRDNMPDRETRCKGLRDKVSKREAMFHFIFFVNTMTLKAHIGQSLRGQLCCTRNNYKLVVIFLVEHEVHWLIV